MKYPAAHAVVLEASN